MSRLARGLVAAAMVALGAMASAQQEEGFQMEPVPPPPGTRIERDIAYGSNPAQRLDLYRPARADKAPVLIMVHGGGWWRGDKARAPVVDNKVNHWIPKGYIVASVNYRMVPEADPLAQATDVAKSVAYIQSRASEWGGDPERVVLMGHSAGGHLIALLAAAPEIAQREGVKPWLGTIPLDSGAYDVNKIMQGRHFALYDRAFGADQQLWREASPTLRLKSRPAPMLLVCSSKRAESCAMAEEFADKARSLHAQITVLPVDMTHGEINGLLGVGGAYTDAVDEFMDSLGLH